MAMAVVIGDFEVVGDAAPQSAPAGPAEATRQAALDPLDLQQILAELDEQALRLWAH
jgi:hypothetical protein